MSDYLNYLSAKNAGNLGSLNPKQIEEAAKMGIYPNEGGPQGQGTAAGYANQMKSYLQPGLDKYRTGLGSALNKATATGQEYVNRIKSAYPTALQETLNKYLPQNALNLYQKTAQTMADIPRSAEQFGARVGQSVGQVARAAQQMQARYSPVAETAARALENVLPLAQFEYGARVQPLEAEAPFVGRQQEMEISILPKAEEAELNALLTSYQTGVQMSEADKTRMQDLAMQELRGNQAKQLAELQNQLAIQQLQYQSPTLSSVGKGQYAYWSPKSQAFEYLNTPTTPATTTPSNQFFAQPTSSSTQSQPYNKATSEISSNIGPFASGSKYASLLGYPQYEKFGDKYFSQ